MIHSTAFNQFKQMLSTAHFSSIKQDLPTTHKGGGTGGGTNDGSYIWVG